MFYLVLYYCIQGCGVTTIPEKYLNLEDCQKSAKAWDSAYFRCIPAPKLSNCVASSSNPSVLECR